MSCSGLHCAGCAGGAAVPVVPLVTFCGLAWVAEHIIEVAVISAACGALAVAAVVALMRWQDRRQAAFAARASLFRVRASALPPAGQRTVPQAAPPAIENHFHIHLADGDMAARVIRTAIPGCTGDGTEGE